MALVERVGQLLSQFEDMKSTEQHLQTTLETAQAEMEKIYQEQELLEQSNEALKQAKPLLSRSSIEDCEKLANMAVQAVFELPAAVRYSPEKQCFVLDYGEGHITKIASAEGGGINSVIGILFDIYLIIKLHKRRVLFLDEQFAGVSTTYLERFIVFFRKLCNDLHFDVVLVTHDQRLTDDQVDHVYELSDGISHRIK